MEEIILTKEQEKEFNDGKEEIIDPIKDEPTLDESRGE